jgi:hypothetical protein
VPEGSAAVAATLAEPPPAPWAALLAAPDGVPPTPLDEVAAWGGAAVPKDVWGRTLAAAAAAGVVMPVELAGSGGGA